EFNGVLRFDSAFRELRFMVSRNDPAKSEPSGAVAWRLARVVFGGARQVQQGAQGWNQGVIANAAHALGRAGEGEQGRQRRGVLGPTVPANGVAVIRAEQPRPLAGDRLPAAQVAAIGRGRMIVLDYQVGHGSSASGQGEGSGKSLAAKEEIGWM